MHTTSRLPFIHGPWPSVLHVHAVPPSPGPRPLSLVWSSTRCLASSTARSLPGPHRIRLIVVIPSTARAPYIAHNPFGDLRRHVCARADADADAVCRAVPRMPWRKCSSWRRCPDRRVSRCVWVTLRPPPSPATVCRASFAGGEADYVHTTRQTLSARMTQSSKSPSASATPCEPVAMVSKSAWPA